MFEVVYGRSLALVKKEEEDFGAFFLGEAQQASRGISA